MLILKGEKHHLPKVHFLIEELARFEKEPEAVVNTIENLEKDLSNKLFDFFVIEVDGDVVGFALYYIRYSTWKGKSFYLEDFFIQSEYRNTGFGKKLFEKCIQRAKEMGCYQMNWQVLDWNKGAIRFYERIGASISKEWYNGSMEL
jgi:hypothetical protein